LSVLVATTISQLVRHLSVPKLGANI